MSPDPAQDPGPALHQGRRHARAIFDGQAVNNQAAYYACDPAFRWNWAGGLRLLKPERLPPMMRRSSLRQRRYAAFFLAAKAVQYPFGSILPATSLHASGGRKFAQIAQWLSCGP